VHDEPERGCVIVASVAAAGSGGETEWLQPARKAPHAISAAVERIILMARSFAVRGYRSPVSEVTSR
jgi:hypothetical protein